MRFKKKEILEMVESIRTDILNVKKFIEQYKERFIGNGELYDVSYNQDGIIIFFKENDKYLRNEITWEEHFDFINEVLGDE